MKNLIVGAGFSGAAIARLLAENNEDVIIIDKKSHVAGNSCDYRDENGIMIHKYGSHIFHTNSYEIWKFVCRFGNFNQYVHKVYAQIDNIKTVIPFNLGSLYDVFSDTLAKKLEEKLLLKYKNNAEVSILEFLEQDDDDLKFLANYIYEKIFLNYTKKQWGTSPKNLDNAITARVPLRLSKDDRYFQDKYQGIPIEGYSKLIENMLNHPKIKIQLNTKFDKNNSYERIFYTGSIDEFFDYKFGKLPYRSIKLEFETHNCEFYQKNSVINYPNDYDFTRIHEFKYYLGDKSSKTVIAKEYPRAFELNKNERCYPILNKENIDLYNKYAHEAKKLKNLYFFGRLGDYRYYNMDETIARAIEIFKEVSK